MGVGSVSILGAEGVEGSAQKARLHGPEGTLLGDVGAPFAVGLTQGLCVPNQAFFSAGLTYCEVTVGPRVSEPGCQGQRELATCLGLFLK